MEIRDTVGYDPVIHEAIMSDMRITLIVLVVTTLLVTVFATVYKNYKQSHEKKIDDENRVG